jgi:hypothetical protein
MGPFLAACETNVRTGAAEVKIREPILETGASVGKQLVEGDGAVLRHRQRRLPSIVSGRPFSASR